MRSVHMGPFYSFAKMNSLTYEFVAVTEMVSSML